MARNCFQPEQIISKLRKAEVLLANAGLISCYLIIPLLKRFQFFLPHINPLQKKDINYQIYSKPTKC